MPVTVKSLYKLALIHKIPLGGRFVHVNLKKPLLTAFARAK